MRQLLRRLLLLLLNSFSALSWMAVGIVVPPLSSDAPEETEPDPAIGPPPGHPERPGRTRPLTPAERELLAGLGEIDWW